MTKIVFAVVLAWFAVFFVFLSPSFADHSGPERVVENKYVVILLLNPKREQMLFRFIFRDIHTGRNLLTPVTFNFSVEDEGGGLAVKNIGIKTEKGTAEFLHEFQKGGIYKVSLEFEKADEPGKVYRPENWSIWVPGQTYNPFGRYPVGFAEIAGFSALFLALLVFLGSIWWQKKKGKPLEINLFKK